MNMTRKEWKEPQIVVEEFMANEYVAACGDSGKTYYFKCNAGYRGNEYAVKDANGRFLKVAGHKVDGDDWYYHPCGETHIAESDSGFLTGYHIDDLHTWRDERIQVIVWTEGGTDVHCTTNLDMDSWETAKS